MAGRRRKVGLIFSYDERWVAGAYYIYNLVHALKTLPDSQLPSLTIFANSLQDYNKLKKETNYPYTSLFLMRRTNFFSKVKVWLNLRVKSLSGYDLFDTRPTANDADCVFPLLYSRKEYFAKIPRSIFWIPDFQEHFYPQFFSANDIEMRKNYQLDLSRTAARIVFSSLNAKDHYQMLYPTHNSMLSVLNFAVTHSAISDNVDLIKTRYGINGNYFLCSNQFWKHKNHELVLQAIASAKSNTPELFVVFTGKADDYRNPGYYDSLVRLVETMGISENVAFLGLIPREDQLALLKNAKAVIQPSLFEGWSTVIEDAKSFSQFIIASAIDVHKEQLIDYPNCCLFNYANPQELSSMLIKYSDNTHVKLDYDYRIRINQFVLSFIEAIND